MNDRKGTIDFSDEIQSLVDIRGSLTILGVAGDEANEYSELFSYQLITRDAFKRHIEAIGQVVGKLRSLDNSGSNYQ